MKRTLLKLLLAATSFCVCFVVVDYGYGLVVSRVDAKNLHKIYRIDYADENRVLLRKTKEKTVLDQAIAKGILVIMPADLTPRPPQLIWAPNATFFLCYTGVTQPYFDDKGCVKNAINSRQLREREELMGPKPEGQKRILCLGDSFTFGWGVRAEDTWTRLVEKVLRKQDDGIRTINAGASGTMQVDEYEWALTKRFYDLEPDAVIVTLCLNDLLPTSAALAHHNHYQPWYHRSNILTALFSRYAMYGKLQIEPDRDLVQELLDLPAEFCPPWVKVNGGHGVFWPGGGPQKALVNIRDWCKKKKIPFGVIIWPFFQGLGKHEHYPFTKIHTIVGAFCAENDIGFLDLLPTFQGKRDTSDYWVSPADSHGNHLAQQDATEPIAAFIRRITNL